MLKLFYDLYASFHWPQGLSAILALISLLAVAIFLGYVGHKICSQILLQRLYKTLEAHDSKVADILRQQKIFRKILYFLIPTVILAFLQPSVNEDTNPLVLPMILFADKLVATYIIVLLGILIDSLLEAGRCIYNLYPISSQWPIRTYVQFLKIFNFIIFAVFVVCHLIGQSPIAFFTGLGAVMALILLIFKDSILSFVASLQISASQILRIGDWIEISEKKINGHVLEMSLNTIKIQNFDKSIATVPPYYITNNPIINWRSMFDTGARRIKRSVQIDPTSIAWAQPALLESLKSLPPMQEYLALNTQEEVLGTTNLGLFRHYMELYMVQQDDFHDHPLTFMMRPLEQTEAGALPLEIYTFTKETTTKDYEHIQATLLEHLIASLPLFQLRLYQPH